jgi:uncharacterized protein YhaN
VRNARRHASAAYKRSLARAKLKLEIAARNELNARLADVNAFLDERAKQRDECRRVDEDNMFRMQTEMGQRLQQTKDELENIKQHMRGGRSKAFPMFATCTSAHAPHHNPDTKFLD